MRKQRLNHIKMLVAGAAVLAMSSAASAGDAAKVGGFVDAQWEIGGMSTGGLNKQTFTVQDAAIYVSKDLMGGSVNIDLPFSTAGSRRISFGSEVTSAINNQTTQGLGKVYLTNTQGDNDVYFAMKKAQAYVSYKYDNGLHWRLGQFDSPYGMEKRDTVDIAFTRQAYVTAAVLNLTYTGLMFGYSHGDKVGIDFLLSDPAGYGMSQVQWEGGTNFWYKDNGWRFQLGGTFRSMRRIGKSVYLIDTVLGYNKDSWDLALEFDANKVGSLNSGWGPLVEVQYAFNDSWAFAFRGGYMKSGTNANTAYPDDIFQPVDPQIIAQNGNAGTTIPFIAQAGFAKPVPAPEHVLEFSIGPQYSFTKELKGKFDYNYFQYRTDKAANNKDLHYVRVSAVYKL